MSITEKKTENKKVWKKVKNGYEYHSVTICSTPLFSKTKGLQSDVLQIVTEWYVHTCFRPFFQNFTIFVIKLAILNHTGLWTWSPDNVIYRLYQVFQPTHSISIQCEQPYQVLVQLTSKLIKGYKMGPFLTNIHETLQPNWMPTQQYYLDPPGIGHQIITRDDTVFHLRDKKDLMFVTTAPACKGNNSPKNIRAGYMAFTTFVAAKGEYSHPYFCFCKDHVSSPKGFSVGKDNNYIPYDLPSWYHTSINTWSQQIHQALLHKNVFPVGLCDEQIAIVNTHSW